jgi:8-oxo-dGTP diphosphatase
LKADWDSSEPKVLEPEKCENWSWYDLDDLPKNLFYQMQLALESYKTGKNYFDIEK